MKISSLETQKNFGKFLERKDRIKSQKIGWKNITKISDVPSNYDEGYLFMNEILNYENFRLIINIIPKILK